jgi:hypothetical protein
MSPPVGPPSHPTGFRLKIGGAEVAGLGGVAEEIRRGRAPAGSGNDVVVEKITIAHEGLRRE